MTTRTGFLIAAVMTCGAFAAVTACGDGSLGSGFGNGASSSGSTGSSSNSSFGSSNGGASGGASGGEGTIDECKKMDIVFVVDNSGSMEQEQGNLGTNFPTFVNVINAYKTKGGDQLDYRIAVTSSDDVADKGTFFKTAGPAAPQGCSAGPARPWLERGDGNVAAAFSCRAQLGVNGTNNERVLEAALLGVTSRINDNTNTDNGTSFLREDALLAMVLLSDEDEGSKGGKGNLARPMADYPPAFDKVKGERGRWAAAVIAGETACTSAFGDAAEAVRLKGFVSSVGKNGVFSSICAGDLSEGLTKALATFDQACRSFPTGPVK